MEPVLISIIIINCIQLIIQITSKIKKSKCFGAEIEMKDDEPIINQQKNI